MLRHSTATLVLGSCTCSVHGANVMFVVEGPLMNGRTGEYSSITVTQCSPTTAETWSPSVANGLRLSASL